MIYVWAYAAAAIVFIALDMLWLGVVARGFYHGQIGGLLRQPFNVPAAIVFYVLYMGGVLFFAMAPAIAAQSLRTAALCGFLLGLLAYGTYDLTNLATLKGWTVTITIADMLWGAVLTMICSVAGVAAARAITA
ncbi:MAG: DUF2177 family protein [Sphingomonadales bacterium]